MNTFFCKDVMKYDGTQLHSLFNYKTSKIKGDSIVVFLGEMDVETSHMVDCEDVIKSDFIWSPQAVNFVIEIFHIGIETAVLYQRAFMSICAEQLKKKLKENVIVGFTVELDGDDIMIRYPDDEVKKLSVSIATVSHVSGLIHTGLNIEVDQKIPVPAVGLKDLLIDSKIMNDYIKVVAEYFKEFVEDVKLAAVKVRGV